MLYISMVTDPVYKTPKIFWPEPLEAFKTNSTLISKVRLYFRRSFKTVCVCWQFGACKLLTVSKGVIQRKWQYVGQLFNQPI